MIKIVYYRQSYSKQGTFFELIKSICMYGCDLDSQFHSFILIELIYNMTMRS